MSPKILPSVLFHLVVITSYVYCYDPPYISSSVFSSNVSTISDKFLQESCPPFDRVEHGKVTIKEFMGQTAAYITCDKNFTLVGKSIVLTECYDGVWKFDFKLPKCEKRCPSPPYLEHGNLDLEKKLEDVYSPTGTYLEGTVATYTCKDGYILEPTTSAFRICELGQWSGNDAFCKPTREINCARPAVIENGYIQPSFNIEYPPIFVGQEVLYKCLPGYKLVGASKVKCSEQGVWLPDPPVCHKDTGRNLLVKDKETPGSTVTSERRLDWTSYKPAIDVNLLQPEDVIQDVFQTSLQDVPWKFLWDVQKTSVKDIIWPFGFLISGLLRDVFIGVPLTSL